jgi:hypothetical protein
MNILRFVAPSEADTRQLDKTRANAFIVSEPALAACGSSVSWVRVGWSGWAWMGRGRGGVTDA